MPFAGPFPINLSIWDTNDLTKQFSIKEPQQNQGFDQHLFSMCTILKENSHETPKENFLD